LLAEIDPLLSEQRELLVTIATLLAEIDPLLSEQHDLLATQGHLCGSILDDRREQRAQLGKQGDNLGEQSTESRMILTERRSLSRLRADETFVVNDDTAGSRDDPWATPHVRRCA